MQYTSNLLFDKNARPCGITYKDWTILWWKWLLGIPSSTNPAMDQTGENASLNQPHSKVFFLCQTIEGRQGIPNRSICVPTGTMLLMPVINWLSIWGDDGETDNELSLVAKKKMDVVSNLQFSMNNCLMPINLEMCRVTSNFFCAYFHPDNVFGIGSPYFRPALSDGYWIFLKPLKSDCAITTFGSCSKGITKIGINYKVKMIN